MRYFQYPEIKKLHKRAKREVFASLEGGSRRRLICKRIFDGIAGCLCVLLLIAVIGLLSWGTAALKQSGLNEALRIFCSVFAWVFGLCFGFLMAMLIGAACSKGSEKMFGSVGDEFDAAVVRKKGSMVAEFYGLDGEYIVTKCFYCSRKEFIGKDVCLFFNGQRLRVVGDFIDRGEQCDPSKGDVGCLEWDLKTCQWSRADGEYAEHCGANATLIREGIGEIAQNGGEFILLGKKALPFIKNQLYKNSECYQKFEEWIAQRQKAWAGQGIKLDKRYISPYYAIQCHVELSSPFALGKISYYESNGYHWVDFEAGRFEGEKFLNLGNIPFASGEDLSGALSRFEKFMTDEGEISVKE